LIDGDLDYGIFISNKIGGFYNFNKNTFFKNFGISAYYRNSNTVAKLEQTKIVSGGTKRNYYTIDEKIKSLGLLISSTSKIIITKQCSLLICPFIGIIQRYQVRENNSALKNTIYDKRYTNTKNVIHADLYTCLSYNF
jgi:hypothetical protein